MTEKLYYQDAYIKEFTASVVTKERVEAGYLVELDRTAFFPEEGGQTSDTGVIGGARVIDVKEQDGRILHLLEADPGDGEVYCRLDFDKRFEKMQCHTAEHILCGIIHERHGYDNVGFHLGDDIVTFDVDGELSSDEIDEVERLANLAVMTNRSVITSFPSEAELASLTYRSKLDIKDGVRIVRIEGVDSCACCAPHVAQTGEIGMIKIIDYMRHRGGMRLFMVAGTRALDDYKKRYAITRAIGAKTSTPSLEALSAVGHLEDEILRLEAELSASKRRIADLYIGAIPSVEGNYVLPVEGLGMEEMRHIANTAKSRIAGTLILLCGLDGDFRYLMISEGADMGARAREINSALHGKGGGRGEMITGTLSASLCEIEAYFK
ncbi:MAG: alanyl-tRNA editing protein [Clostridia bacterium]|nr:alanyl-tRNA editing protein [Clostridia bacterium]